MLKSLSNQEDEIEKPAEPVGHSPQTDSMKAPSGESGILEAPLGP